MGQCSNISPPPCPANLSPTARIQNKKWEEHSKAALVRYVEEQAGRKMTDAERRMIVHGAEEVDLVYSGM